jgi:hypothetical protein
LLLFLLVLFFVFLIGCWGVCWFHFFFFSSNFIFCVVGLWLGAGFQMTPGHFFPIFAWSLHS